MAQANRSRTIKTLATLVAAMVVGAFVLIKMERPPVTFPMLLRAEGLGESSVSPQNPYHTEQAAIVQQTGVPVQINKWRNIIIYDVVCDGEYAPVRQTARGYHFLIGTSRESMVAEGRFGDGVVRSTECWIQQADGDHVRVSGRIYDNEDSIGICLFCDTDRLEPTQGQMNALTDLVRALQVILQIPPDRIYLSGRSDTTDRMGRFFPFETFRSRLITARR